MPPARPSASRSIVLDLVRKQHTTSHVKQFLFTTTTTKGQLRKNGIKFSFLKCVSALTSFNQPYEQYSLNKKKEKKKKTLSFIQNLIMFVGWCFFPLNYLARKSTFFPGLISLYPSLSLSVSLPLSNIIVNNCLIFRSFIEFISFWMCLLWKCHKNQENMYNFRMS